MVCATPGVHFETSSTSPKVEITGRDDGSGVHKGENGYITVPLLKNLVGIRGTATTSPYALCGQPSTAPPVLAPSERVLVPIAFDRRETRECAARWA